MNTSKTISMNSVEFKMMSETHLKILVSQGFNINILDVDTTPKATKVAYNKPVSKSNADNKVAVATKTNKKDHTTKGKKSSTKKANNNDLPFGKNIKVGGFVKIYNLTTKKVVMAGKVKDLDKTNNAVELTNTRKYAIENCVAISEKEFAKLKKSLKLSAKAEAKKDSTSTRLSPQDYKLCYAKYLVSLGKITEDDFAKAKDDKAALHDLYEMFAKGDEKVKLTNADAMKIFAENSAKVAA